jgi:hypothetical protein
MAIIDKPSDYFVSNLHTGNGGTLNITSLDFQPDLVWVKERNNAKDHAWYDSVRGANQLLESNKTTTDSTTSAGISSFNSNGWTTGDFFQTNDNGDSYVSWNWKESADAGFDIVSYTGNGSNRTISHSCGAIPKMIIIKDRSAADNWNVYNSSSGNNSHMHLNLTNAASGSSSYWNTTTPTSSVFSLGSNSAVNANGNNFIAYCFADTSMSKMGSYTGNGNANGTFVYTGFKPAFVITKRTDGAANWAVKDNKRETGNPVSNLVWASANDAESDNYILDFLSNGFKIRDSSAGVNGSGNSYIYMAFAENPFVTSTGVPATAR